MKTKKLFLIYNNPDDSIILWDKTRNVLCVGWWWWCVVVRVWVRWWVVKEKEEGW